MTESAALVFIKSVVRASEPPRQRSQDRERNNSAGIRGHHGGPQRGNQEIHRPGATKHPDARDAHQNGMMRTAPGPLGCPSMKTS